MSVITLSQHVGTCLTRVSFHPKTKKKNPYQPYQQQSQSIPYQSYSSNQASKPLMHSSPAPNQAHAMYASSIYYPFLLSNFTQNWINSTLPPSNLPGLLPTPYQNPNSVQWPFSCNFSAHDNNSNSVWHPDSGETHHVTYDLPNIALQHEFGGSEKLLIGDGKGLTISHVGSNNFLHNQMLTGSYI